MEERSKNALILVVGLALLAGLGFLIYRDLASPSTPVDSPTATTTGVTEGEGRVETGLLPTPDLTRPYRAPERLPADIRAESEAHVADVISKLKENDELYSHWLDLAIYRKNADDYAGAEEIWLYVADRWPFEPVAYANLADLYQNFLVDYPKAEANLKKVIGLKPDYVPAYRNLHDLYRLKYKTETTAAEDILLLGIDNNPGNVDLMVPLALYYKEKGNYAGARSYLEQSLVETEKAGKRELADAIRAEIATLP